MNRALTREVLRAGWDGLCWPLRLFDEFVCREALREELTALLESPAPAPAVREHGTLRGEALPTRALDVFVSCAEPSGEAHLLGWIWELRSKLAARGAQEPRLFGLGGARLAAAGVELIADTVAQATMGFRGVAARAPFYLRTLERSVAAIESRGTDLALMVDSPALHAPLGRMLQGSRVPRVLLAAPQMWGWASWRSRGLARAFDRLLAFFPFEPAWFARRGIDCVHVGHPLLDAPRPHAPLRETSRNAPVQLALLCGSRRSIVARHLPWMLDRALELKALLPGLTVRLPQQGEATAAQAQALLDAHPARAFTALDRGPLAQALAQADAAFSVSGTVLIDVLLARLPCVVIYRLAGEVEAWLGQRLLLSPYFAAPNLLVGRPALPEFAFAGRGPVQATVQALERALLDAPWRAATRQALARAERRLGTSGATARAVDAALELVGEREHA